jgi:phospholipid/cholesterol/gamma-HCH transport system permease protein
MIWITRTLEVFGRQVVKRLSEFGDAWIFFAKVWLRALTPPYSFSLLVEQMYSIGFQSLSVVSLVGLFTGAVLAVQGEYTLSKFGATGFTGSAIALSLIRELGPVLTALMVTGRAGSALTAELGIMKITEQVDALRAMAVDPLRHLMVPRVLAAVISVPLLTAVFDLIGIAGGYCVGVWSLGLPSGTFITQMIHAVQDVDIISGFVKSLAFGVIIAWVCCYKGWTCGFGAVGVNKATTSAVVTSSVTILVVDYFLTSILTQVFL